MKGHCFFFCFFFILNWLFEVNWAKITNYPIRTQTAAPPKNTFQHVHETSRLAGRRSHNASSETIGRL